MTDCPSYSADELPDLALRVLRVADIRPRGNICPTKELTTKQQKKILEILRYNGFITKDEMDPRITCLGRAAVRGDE